MKIKLLMFLILVLFTIFSTNVLADVSYYNFTDTTNNKCYWAHETADPIFPPSWTTGWTTTNQCTYTNLVSDNTAYFDVTPGSNNDEDWIRFNFTISEAVGDINWMYFHWNGLCAYDTGEDADCFIADFITGGGTWAKACDMPTSDNDCTTNITSSISNYIQGNQVAFLCMGSQIDAADPIRSDFMEVRVGWTILYPTYANNGTNVTGPAPNDQVLHYVNWTAGSGTMSGYIFSNNYSGVWSNKTWTSMTTWSNETNTSSTAGTYGWRIYANNSFNKWNDTGIQVLTFTAVYPTYSNNGTNNSAAKPNDQVLHYVNWSTSSGTLSGYIFSNNYSGIWSNSTWTAFSGGTWSNQTNTSATAGTWGWRVYANNSYNLWNDTDIQIITFVNKWLEVNWTEGSQINSTACTSGSPCRFTQNSTFNANATVICKTNPSGYSCGTVSGSIRYNQSGSPDTLINTTEGATPFYIIGGSGDASPTTVGLTQVATATEFTFQRKAFYASNRFWVFYSNSTDMVYATSTDGSTWSEPISLGLCTNGYDLSVHFDGTYVHYARYNNYDLFYRRGTPNSDGTISWSAAEQTAFDGSASSYHYRPMISVDSGGYAWIGTLHETEEDPYVIKNNNNDGTWSTAASFPYQLTILTDVGYSTMVIPLTSSKVYVVYGFDTAIPEGKLYDGGWGSEEVDILSYALSSGRTDGIFSAVAQGDDIHFMYLRDTTYQVRYSFRDYDGSPNKWLTSDVLVQDSVTSTSFPTLSINTANNNLYSFWAGYPTSNHIYYKKYASGTWDTDPTDWITEVSLTTDNARLTSYQQSYGNRIGLVYMNGTGPDFQVRHKFLGVFSNIQSCSLSDNQQCQLNWTVNYTGTTYHVLDANFSSSIAAITLNNTSLAYVKIESGGCEPGQCIYNKSYLQSLLFIQNTAKIGNFFKTQTQALNESQNLGNFRNIYTSMSESFSVAQLFSRLSKLYKDLTSYFTLSPYINNINFFYRNLSQFFTLSQSITRIRTILESVTSYFSINQLSSRLSNLYGLMTQSLSISQSISRFRTVYTSITGYFAVNQSISNLISFLRSITSYISINQSVSRFSSLFRVSTSSFLISQSVSRISSFFMFLLQLFGITASPTTTASQYTLTITNPTSSSPMQVVSDENITIAFNFTNLTGQPIVNTSECLGANCNVNVTNITFYNSTGSGQCVINTGQEPWYNTTDGLWRVNCTTPDGIGPYNLYLQANETGTYNIIRDNTQTDAIIYSQIYQRLVSLSFTLSQSLSRISSNFRYLSGYFSINQLSSRITTIYKSFTSSSLFGNALSRTSLMFNTLSQSLSISQLSSRLSSLFRLPTSSFLISQSYSRLYSPLRSMISSMSISQSASRIGEIYKSLTSSFLINQTSSILSSLYKSLTSSFVFNQSISRLSTVYKSITSNFIYNQSLSRLSSLYKSITGYFSLSQSLSRISNLYTSLTSYFKVNQYTSRIGTLYTSLTSYFNINQSLSRIRSIYTSITGYFNINQSLSRIRSIYTSITGYFTVGQYNSRISYLSRLVTSNFIINQTLTRISSIFNSISSYFSITQSTFRIQSLFNTLSQSLSISQLSSRLSSLFRLPTSSFLISQSYSRIYSPIRSIISSLTISQSLSRISNLYTSLTSYFTVNQYTSRIGTLYTSITGYFNINQSLSRIPSFIRFLLQLLGITASPTTTASQYVLTITNPTTSSPMQVVSDENITIAFNFTNLTGQPISSGINVTSILIGSNNCPISVDEWYNESDKLWRVNCTTPTNSGIKNLYLEANDTNDNMVRQDTQVNAIDYSGIKRVIISLFLTLGNSVQRISSLSTTLLNVININTISSRIYNSYTSMTSYFSISNYISRMSSIYRSIDGYFVLNQEFSGLSAITKMFYDSFGMSSYLSSSLYSFRSVAGSFLLNTVNTRMFSAYRSISQLYFLTNAVNRIQSSITYASSFFSIQNSFSSFSTLLRTISGEFYVTGLSARVQSITRVFSQQFSTILNVLDFRTGTINERMASLSLTFSGSIQRTFSVTRTLTETISIKAVFGRSLSIIRAFLGFFGIDTRIYGVIPICSAQITEPNCAFVGGCYWCSGTCQASTCTQPTPTPPISGEVVDGYHHQEMLQRKSKQF